MTAVAPTTYGPAARRSALKDYRRKQQENTWSALASELRAQYDAMEARHAGWL